MKYLLLAVVPFFIAMSVVGVVAFILPMAYESVNEFKHGIWGGLFSLAIFGSLALLLTGLLVYAWYAFIMLLLG